jgi:tRNA pseudouridine38-40 synthase
MREASTSLIGSHDFASFATQHVGTTQRTLFAADWRQVNPTLLLFEVCATGFLKHMVRGVVGSLLWVGGGRWSPTEFERALKATDRRAAGPNAPAHGLTLHRIDY